jgi:DNA-binding protein H-NS
MTKMNGLDKMSLAKLKELRARVDKVIADRESAERTQLRKKVEEMAAAAGLSLADLIGQAPRKGRSVAVKYRNPKDASQTWTGRGRPPRWFADAMKKGAKKESFLV